MKHKLAILLLGLSLMALNEAQAQAARTLDLARMQRDVEIMEMVLDRLLNREASRHFMRLGSGSARGTYVPNFGVLFQIPNSSSVVTVYELRERALVEKRAAAGRGANASSPRPTRSETNLNEELWEFFSRYADAIGQLSDNDRIAVYSAGNSEFSFFFEMTGEEASSFTAQSGDFFAWMTKGDLAALRAGKLSESEFRNRMRTTKLVEGNDDVEIMSGILDKLTGNRNGSAHGFYVQDYGVIFFAEANFAPTSAQRFWSTQPREREATPAAYNELENVLREARAVEQERAKNWQEDYKKFRAKIAEALADYGHTLRSLKPDDWLVVTIDFRFAPEEQPRGLVCQIKKRELEAFSSGKITREQLLKAVAYFEN